MEKDEILNSKGKKKLFEKIHYQWGTDTDKIKDLVFIRKPSGKIFITKKETAEDKMEFNVRIYSLGNYFCKEERDEVRVSIEGSQIIGKYSFKNVIDLDEESIRAWMKGDDIKIDEKITGFCLVRKDDDFYGCGRASKGQLLNHIPKTRRIKNMI